MFYEADEMCGMCKVDSTTAYKIGILILYQNLMHEIVTYSSIQHKFHMNSFGSLNITTNHKY